MAVAEARLSRCMLQLARFGSLDSTLSSWRLVGADLSGIMLGWTQPQAPLGRSAGLIQRLPWPALEAEAEAGPLLEGLQLLGAPVIQQGAGVVVGAFWQLEETRIPQ